MEYQARADMSLPHPSGALSASSRQCQGGDVLFTRRQDSQCSCSKFMLSLEGVVESPCTMQRSATRETDYCT